jgi:type IX secretion system PorP/SprF family membrane protein
VNDGFYRVTANYRYQWPTISSPFITKGVSGDMSISDAFSVGMTVLSQTTGDGGYYYNNGYVSVSYKARLTEYKIISGGFQIGMLNRGIDPGKFQYGNQYNPLIGYDPTIPSNEQFIRTNATALDGSLGLVYFDAEPDKATNAFFGVSAYHPTQPRNQFLANGNNNKIPMRYALHGGLRMRMSDRVDLTPHAVLLKQGDASEITGGISMNMQLQDGADLLLGTTYRLNDAVAPNIGIHLNGLTIGFSYDINMSKMKTASSGNGGYELSISFIGRRKITDSKFVCPRL